MKIIGHSNFDLETVNEILIAENINPEYANGIVDYMNETFSSSSADYYFFLVEDDRELYKFEP
ncbi:MAG TPA: hypothetical protein DCY00_07475 [Actinobacteria bacterium]|nr:hypothetical protein [Actinomycetota bacterium]